MISALEVHSCEPAAAVPAQMSGGVRARRLAAEAKTWVRSDDRAYPFSFLNIIDVLGVDADAVRARLLRVSRTTCPEVRVRVVTERSPKAVFRHVDIQGPPPRDRLEPSAIAFPNATSTKQRSQS